MNLDPILDSGPAIQLHTVAALLAFSIGLVQFAGPKGTTVHRILGWTWAVSMAIVAVTAFFIHELRVVGDWSPIHILAVVTLVTLPGAVAAARAHRVHVHKKAMTSLFLFALIVAGIFTLWPGRILHAVLFG